VRVGRFYLDFDSKIVVGEVDVKNSTTVRVQSLFFGVTLLAIAGGKND
jgi:hypothetical protein